MSWAQNGEGRPVVSANAKTRPSKPRRSSSAAAIQAKQDESIAAVCPPEAVEKYELKQIEHLAHTVTTFGIFVNEPLPMTLRGDALSEFQVLLRNAHLFSGRVEHGGKAAFADLLSRKRPLTVKWGIDPISKSLHLGHVACLFKLQQFLKHGHQLKIVLGTFTGQIGDPSGNISTRPRISSETLKSNAEIMKVQIEAFLDSPLLRFQYNAELVKGFDLDRLMQWAYSLDYRLLIGRTDFQNRLDYHYGLTMAELLYSLFQAYDTMVLDTDVEIGGTDQIHNAFFMREIMKLEERNVPFALLIPTLPGIDSQPKMSSFAENVIYIDQDASSIRKQLSDIKEGETILTYMRMLSDITDQEIHNYQLAFKHGADVEDLSNRMVDAVMNKLHPALERLHNGDPVARKT